MTKAGAIAILTTVVLGLSGWMSSTVFAVSQRVAVVESEVENVKAFKEDIKELKDDIKILLQRTSK